MEYLGHISPVKMINILLLTSHLWMIVAGFLEIFQTIPLVLLSIFYE